MASISALPPFHLPTAMNPHFYPPDLALELRARWPALASVGSLALPPLDILTQLISVAYQASLLREESRPVSFRLALLPASLDCPHLLEFETPRPYDEQEIRRLSPAVQAPRTLLAVRLGAEGELQITGLLLSNHDWDQLAELPHPSGEPAPTALLLQVRGPGELVFYAGPTRVLTLQRGRLDGHGFVQFPLAWSRGRFTEAIDFVHQHLGPSPVLEVPALHEFLMLLAQHVVRRVLARVRAGGHGGMVVLVPTASAGQCVGPGATLRPKYKLRPAHPDHQYHALLLRIIARLAELGEVSWPRYQRISDAHLAELDVEVGQFAETLADLMAVDGALVLTKQLEIVGFGVEVYAPPLSLESVYRALDVDAATLRAEAPDRGGTRHRAAYRLCLAEPASMAIVISQDGGVRFVHQQAGQVVFWEQLAL